MPLQPFTAGGTVTIASGAASARAALAAKSHQICVSNASAAWAFLKVGDSSVTAAATDFPLAPNSQQVLSIPPSATHAAVINPTGTGPVYITAGSGL